ncbi:MAG: hypothetical protein FWD59_10260, partial [Micrococcales bacterium]|nr:hypothetical protein [Micrococcales bacterium]
PHPAAPHPAAPQPRSGTTHPLTIPPSDPTPWAERPARPRRSLLALLLAVLFLAISTLSWPTAIALAALWLWTGHTFARVTEATRQLRARRGPRSFDRARAFARTPLALIKSLATMIPSLALATLFGWLANLAVLEIADRWLDTSGELPRILAHVIGLAIGMAFAWWGPMADLTRYGSLAILTKPAPSRGASLLWGLILLAASAAIVLGWIRGAMITWTNPLT